jgi:lipoate-protein ligase A
VKALDLALPTPEENLACDEALLDLCDEGSEGEILRFWEPQEPFVVLGISGKTEAEVSVSACQKKGVPILRRCTGGGTVLQGPGCLNFSLILKIQPGPLSSLTGTTAFIMKRHREVLTSLLSGKIHVQGTSDLTQGAFKFSGNAQRRRKNALLFHGTFLLGLDIALVEELLPIPERKPAYRRQRSHKDFLMNLNVRSIQLKEALKKCWKAEGTLEAIPTEQIRKLAKEKYQDPAWNFKF